MKKQLQKAIALLLSLFLLTSSTSSAFAAGSSQISKSETIYLILEEDGTVKEEIVSDWLHSDRGFSNVEDQSGLEAPENLKSDTQPQKKDGALIWNTEETDLYYQGTSSIPSPISVSISYRLDGKELSPKELSGKSGHLEIEIFLKNNEISEVEINGKKRKIATPFFTVAAALLPTDTFQNVKAEKGMTENDAKTQLICFLSLPGAADSLKGLIPESLSELEKLLEDTLTIEADVTEFSAPAFLFAASPSLKGLDLETAELPDDFKELKSATEKLQDGAQSLNEATSTLVEKLAEFSKGYAQFDEGLESARSGSWQLSQGGETLLKNAELLSEKSRELADGAQQLQSGSGTLSNTLNDQLVPGLTAAKEQEAALKGKISVLSSRLDSLTIPDLSSLSGALSQGVGTVFDQAAQGASKAGAKAAGQVVTERISSSLSEVDFSSAAGQIVSSTQNVDLGILQTVLTSPELGLSDMQQQAILSAMQSGQAQAASDLSDGAVQGLKDALPLAALSENPITDQAAAEISAAVCGSSQMQAARGEAISAVTSQIPQIDTGEFSSLLGEFKTLSQEANGMLSQVDALTSSLYNEAAPNDPSTVVGASGLLASGAKTLSEGAGALADGAGAFAGGVNQLSSGAGTLFSGLTTLSSSSKTVSDSITQFQSGASQLKDGADELKTGMDTYADEAIGKLLSMVDPDSELGKVLKAMGEKAKAYRGSGCSDEMDFTVKFVMRTSAAPVPEQKEESTEESEKKSSFSSSQETSFWDRIKGLFS